MKALSPPIHECRRHELEELRAMKIRIGRFGLLDFSNCPIILHPSLDQLKFRGKPLSLGMIEELWERSRRTQDALG
jgi:hypothetical protein